MRFDTLLVANRGEIALRVMRTARRLGLRTVAVYSDADADALHVREADLAVRLGPAEAAASYRSVAAILDACRRSGAQAVHPGYGFLSENAAFAQAVADAGLVFVGPPARVIELMGNKVQAKAAMRAAGVPTVPGAQGLRTDAEVLQAAERVGYPVILKAAAGGGGRGMRIARGADELPALFRLARSEALGAFGSDELLLERAIERARHVEVQVLCDAHGHCLHLGERDCSTQRRFQKLVEEAPSPAVDEALRREMGEIARKACAAIGYTGVGTLEFLLGEDRAFYFMEMNTRLQVEHGVTELVTGLDLVEQQLRVAQGEPLAFGQDAVRLRGHAIELRVCAEDPGAGFMPQVGRVQRWRAPPHARTDTALQDGTEVGAHYDSMVAKILASAPTRAECLQSALRACERTVLLGIRSNLGFLAQCLAHPVLREGRATTGFLAGEDLQAGHWRAAPSDHAQAAAVLLLAGAAGWTGGALRPPAALWLAASFEDDARLRRHAAVARPARLAPQADGGLLLELGPPGGADGGAPAQAWQLTQLQVDATGIRFALDGLQRRLDWWQGEPGSVWLQDGAQAWRYQRIARFDRGGEDSADDLRLRAPMSGRVIAVPVQPGAAVQAGEPLVVMESMKMEMPLAAPRAGRVARVLVEVGAQLGAGQVVAELEEAA